MTSLGGPPFSSRPRCPAGPARSEAEDFFVGSWKSCRGCNKAKRYDVQPTLGPDHGSQHKARSFCL